MKTKLALYLIPLVLIALSSSFALAWTNPIGNPPAGGGIIGAESGAPINSIRIRSTGNVGIGNVNPGGRLDVFTTAVNEPGVVSRDDGGTRMFMVPELSSGGYNPLSQVGDMGLIYQGATQNTGALVIGQWSTSPRGIRIDSSGNVGIGTTNPATTLDVAGTARMTGFQLGTTATAGHVLTANASGVGTWAPPAATTTLNAANVSAGAFGANTGGGNYSFSGNLGIGTATPGERLDVAGGNVRVAGAIRAIGGIPFAGGSNAGFTFSGGGGDTDGGMFSSADGTLQFFTDNVERVRINPAGNVGIGTTAPVRLLHIRGDHNTSQIRLEANNGVNNPANLSFWASEPGVSFEGTGIGNNVTWQFAGTWGPRLINTLREGSYMRFVNATTIFGTVNTANTEIERMRIEHTGNVGIGTTNPATTLDVAGTARMTGFQLGTTATAGHVLTANASGVGTWAPPATTTTLNAANVSAGAFGANTGGGNYSFSGNLGIGTATPGARLDVVGPIAGSGITLRASGDVVLGSGSSIFFDGNYSYATGNYIRNIGANVQAFFTAGTERMRIDTAGNVGIGTTTPGFRLDVAGTIRAGNSANPTWGDIITSQINSNRVYAYERLCVGNSSGNCDGTGGVVIGNTTGTVSLTTGISFFNGGNVGIGTTSPRARLEAAGGSLGTVAGNAVTIGKFGALTGNDDRLIHEAIRITGGTGWDTASHRIRRRVDVTDMGYIQLGHNVSDLITFGEGNTEYMRIDGNGNVGIGTTSPAHRLDVVGDINLPATGFLRIAGNAGAANQVLTRTATGMSWASTPTAPVSSVFGRTGAVVATAGDYSVAQITGAAPSASPIFTGNINFPGSGIWNSAGNVGIGTTNPATTLDVAGTARMTGFQLGTTATAGHVLTANASGVGTWAPPAATTTLNAANVSAGAFGANTGGGNYSFSGNLGIGTTTPGARLEVFGTPGIQRITTIPAGTTGTYTLSWDALQICQFGTCCAPWRDCDGDLWTYMGTVQARDCDEGCPTCFVGSAAGTTTPDGRDQNCDGIVDNLAAPGIRTVINHGNGSCNAFCATSLVNGTCLSIGRDSGGTDGGWTETSCATGHNRHIFAWGTCATVMRNDCANDIRDWTFCRCQGSVIQ